MQQYNSLNGYQTFFRHVVQEVLLKEKAETTRLKEQLKNKTHRLLSREQERIAINEHTTRLLNPANILSRGYTLTLRRGKIVKSVVPLQIGEEIETRFADGKIKSKITNKEHHNNEKDNI